MKRILEIAVIVAVIFAGGYYGGKILRNISQKYRTARIKASVPKFSFTTLENKKFTNKDLTNPNGKIIFEVYAPGCSHCQKMAQRFAKNKDRIKDMEVLMVTPFGDSAKVSEFIKTFGLDSLPNTRFLLDTKNEFYNIFGRTGTPYFYIYENNKLANTIRGETDINNILN